MSGTTAGRRRVRLLARCLVVGGVGRGARGHGVRLDPGAPSGSIHHGGVGHRDDPAPRRPPSRTSCCSGSTAAPTRRATRSRPRCSTPCTRATPATAGTPPTRSSSSTSRRAAAARRRSRSRATPTCSSPTGTASTRSIRRTRARWPTRPTRSPAATPRAGAPTSPFAPRVGAGRLADDPAVRRAALAAGARTTVDTVEALTGLPITHFASVNLAGFADVSQAIGGVPVCLRAPVDDPYSGLDAPRGPAAGQRRPGARVRPAAARAAERRPRPHRAPAGLPRRRHQPAALGGHARQPVRARPADRGDVPLGHPRLRLGRALLRRPDAGPLGAARSPSARSRPGPTSSPTPEDGQAVKVDPAQVRTFVTDAIDLDSGIAPPPDRARHALRPPSRAARRRPRRSTLGRAARTRFPEAAVPDATTAPAPPAPVTAADHRRRAGVRQLGAPAREYYRRASFRDVRGHCSRAHLGAGADRRALRLGVVVHVRPLAVPASARLIASYSCRASGWVRRWSRSSAVVRRPRRRPGA